MMGRVMGQEFAKLEAYPARPNASFHRTAWLPNRSATAYGIVLDTHGTIAWGRSEVGGDPIIVVPTEAVADAHLAGLREDGVGYVFAGGSALNLLEAVTVLSSELGIHRLMLEGGGHLNGGLLR